MIEALKNTAVEVENEERARCVVALYELAGFKFESKWYGDDFLSASAMGCIVIANEYIYMSDSANTSSLITLDQLAWDYGLAPELATMLVRRVKSCDEFGYVIGNKVKFLDGIQWEYDESLFCVISTRPQKQQWPEKGSLPPVGEKVQTSIGQFEVLAARRKEVALDLVHKIGVFQLNEIMPIQSERDRLIELACKVAGEAKAECDVTFCEALYDAGMLKEPD